MLGTLAVAAAALATRADAYIYWANDATPQPSVTGRANLDGTHIIPDFIPGASIASGVAVNSAHIYWINACNGAIGRATLNGRRVNQSFITGLDSPPACGPNYLAADEKHIYWANLSKGAIGRANLDGTGIDENFIPTGVGVRSVAVDATHVYWTNTIDVDGTRTAAIGRANLDGTNVNPSFLLNSNGTGPYVAIALDSTYVYWANQGTGAIGRASLDRMADEEAFIVGAEDPAGVAVDATYIYWTTNPIVNSNFEGAIGRANLDGTQVDQSFIGLPSGAFVEELAVNALPATCVGSDATIAGTRGSDRLRGTKGADVIAAGRGNDTVTGLQGDDLVCGGRGADELRGQGGDDDLRGGRGRDTLAGGGGENKCRGGAGADRKHHC